MKPASLLFVMFCLVLGHELLSQTNIPGGVVSGTWVQSSSPYHIHGDVFINDSLIIEPGVRVIFEGYYDINVSGKLSAEGTSSDSIYFLPGENTDYWKGISFWAYPQSDSNIIDKCVIRYTKSEESAIQSEDSCMLKGLNMGAISVSRDRPLRISNSEIAYCAGYYDTISNDIFPTGAITLYNGAKVLISGNRIHHNQYLSGVYVMACYANILGNEIDHNTSEAGPGICGFPYSAIYVPPPFGAHIEHNNIHHNVALDDYYGGGIWFALANHLFIKSNTIAHNVGQKAAGGLGCMNCDSVFVLQNYIANNQTSHGQCGFVEGGGGLFFHDVDFVDVQSNVVSNNTSSNGGGGLQFVNVGKVRQLNNTIVRNQANGWGGGIMSISSNLQFHNNLYWSNETTFPQTKEIYMTGSSFKARYEVWGDNNSNSFLQSSGTPDTAYIFDYAPLFINPTSGPGVAYDALLADWRLDSLSLCIDAGNPDTLSIGLRTEDNDDNDRIMGTGVDIGAFEFIVAISLDTNDTTVNDTTHGGGGNPSLVQSLEGSPALKVYPNPAHDYIRLINAKEERMNVNVLDLQGRIIVSQKSVTKTDLVDVSLLKAGAYIIQIPASGESKPFVVVR
ncbi:MAG: right-handed parallel beta-helix repeat-containing protein [Flavobacteriales bacterium]